MIKCLRSIGPYSLITQQPLGGKGFSLERDLERWRFGALEGYGSFLIFCKK